MSPARCNIASFLPQRAAEHPDQPAIWCPARSNPGPREDYDSLSYAQLDANTAALASGLQQVGIGRGVRAVLMVRPSFALFELMFALFRVGAVPVLIDPGIDKRALKQCLAEAEPEAFIGIPIAHLARCILGWGRASLRIQVTVGRRWLWGGHSLEELRQLGAASPLPVADTGPDDPAAILFTSGSTGVPKGVEYLHRHFAAQVELLRDAFDIRPGEVDLPTFPPFALFDPALGMTTVIPDMDPTRPAKADPTRLIRAIETFSVSNVFGSPALLDTLSRYAASNNVQLRSVKRIISAGAPVPASVVERARAMMPEGGKLWTPYGATECLPVATVEGATLLGEVRERHEHGAGTCVGRPVAANSVRIIAISDEVIADWDDALLLEPGQIGEITVAGPTVTERYFRRDQATALAKIRDGERVVHRMGDLGYFDVEGLLWFCGRKSQRVETTEGPLYTDPVEALFNSRPGVFRSALVGLGTRGKQLPVICIEPEPGLGAAMRKRLLSDLQTLASEMPQTRGIKQILLHTGFPVDIRHNAKIGREKLALWAARKLKQA